MMDNEEAIKWLRAIEQKYIHGGDEDYDAKRREAIELAIKALGKDISNHEKSVCNSCRLKNTCSDSSANQPSFYGVVICANYESEIGVNIMGGAV